MLQEFEVAEWYWITRGRFRSTTLGGLQSDSGWSWTCRIARVTIHDDKVAPLTSQTLACALFSPSVFDRLPLEVLTWDLHRRILRQKPERSEIMILDCSFPVMKGNFCTCACKSLARNFSRRFGFVGFGVSYQYSKTSTKRPPPGANERDCWRRAVAIRNALSV